MKDDTKVGMIVLGTMALIAMVVAPIAQVMGSQKIHDYAVFSAIHVGLWATVLAIAYFSVSFKPVVYPKKT
jgi:hypothetical protein